MWLQTPDSDEKMSTGHRRLRPGLRAYAYPFAGRRCWSLSKQRTRGDRCVSRFLRFRSEIAMLVCGQNLHIRRPCMACNGDPGRRKHTRAHRARPGRKPRTRREGDGRRVVWQWRRGAAAWASRQAAVATAVRAPRRCRGTPAPSSDLLHNYRAAGGVERDRRLLLLPAPTTVTRLLRRPTRTLLPQPPREYSLVLADSGSGWIAAGPAVVRVLLVRSSPRTVPVVVYSTVQAY
jgi:hypothetical protein